MASKRLICLLSVLAFVVKIPAARQALHSVYLESRMTAEESDAAISKQSRLFLVTVVPLIVVLMFLGFYIRPYIQQPVLQAILDVCAGVGLLLLSFQLFATRKKGAIWITIKSIMGKK